jgi:hypothetical protein
MVQVVWAEDGDIHFRKGYYTGSNDNGGLSLFDTVAINSDQATLPKIALGNGYIYIVWESQGKIMYVRGTNEGVPNQTSFETPIILGEGDSLGHPGIAFSYYVDGSSTLPSVYVTWHAKVEDHYHIFFYRSTDSGTTFDFDPANPPNWTLNVAWINTADNMNPGIIADGQNVHLFWEGSDGSDKVVVLSTSINGGYSFKNHVKSPYPINGGPDPFANSSNPALCAVGESAMVVFQDDILGPMVVFSEKWDHSGPIAYLPTEVGWFESVDAVTPDISCTGTTALIVWQFSSAEFNGIYFSTVPLNSKPIADAGPDQVVLKGIPVYLSGFNSSDPDQYDTIDSYSWTQTSGPSVALDVNNYGATFTAPNVDNDTLLTFQLIVNDGTTDSDPDTVDVLVTGTASFTIMSSGTASLKKATGGLAAGDHEISVVITGEYTIEDDAEFSVSDEDNHTSAPVGMDILSDSIEGTLTLDDEEYELSLQKLTISNDARTINYTFKQIGGNMATVAGFLKFANAINFDDGDEQDATAARTS